MRNFEGEDEILRLMGKNIAYLRSKKKWSLTKLSLNVNLTKGTLSLYENGKSKPGILVLKRICDNLGCNIHDILTVDIEDLDNNAEILRDQFDSSLIIDNCYVYGHPIYQKFQEKKYWLYFLKTDVKKPRTLTYGQLSIANNSDKQRYDIFVEMSDSHIKYTGNFVLTPYQMYFYFRAKNYDERALGILNNPRNSFTKPYQGGLGVISSISTGHEKSPCIQKFILSPFLLHNTETESTMLLDLLSLNTDTDIIRISPEIEKNFYKFIKEYSKKTT